MKRFVIKAGFVSILLAASHSWAQAPTVTNVSMVGSGPLWPSVTTNISVCQNLCNFYFDQSVTGVVTREGGVYFEDGTRLTGFRAQTATFAANKQMSFSNLLLTAREETNFYLQAEVGMVTNANGTWDGIFNLPALVTNRLRFGVYGVYWTNTSDPTAHFTNGANYLAQSAGATEAGVGFMRDGTYELTNFPSTLSRKAFSMDASNAVVRWDIGAGKTLTYNSQAGDASGRSVLSWSAGRTNQLEISSGILDIRLGMVVAEFGYGRLLVSGTNAGYRQGLGAGDSLFLGLSPGSRGEFILSNAAPSYVRAAVVGSLGSARLVVDNSLLTVTNLITIGEKVGHPGSELLITNGGQLVAAALGDITVGNATGVTGATLRVTGAGSRFELADSATLSRTLIIGSGGTVGSQFVVENGGSAYLGGGNSPSGSVFLSRAGTTSGGACLLMVDGSGSTLTATAVRVSVSTSAASSGGQTNTQRFVVSNGGQAVILTDLVLGGSLLNTGQGRDSFNALADIDGGQLTVLSNILFATRLHPTNLASSVFSNHQMMVRGGGVVSAAAITMGNFTNSQSTRLTVTGATSRVDVAGEFRLGHDGRSNVVRVVDGGTLVADQLTLGSGLATNNHLVIDNAAVSITNASGSGLLTLNRGALNLGSGGELRADQLVATNSEGTLTLNAGGRLLLTSTNTSSFGGAGLTIPDGFELGGIGTVAESATINGILSPGLSAGTLAFNNDLTLGSSVQARYELGLPAASDQITVGANLNLNNLVWSNFVFTALGGFASGNYLLVDAAGVSGSLGPETTGTVDGLSAALTLDINNDLVLTVSGTGGGSPVLGVSPAGLSWSGVEVGQSSNLILVVTNSGNAQLDGTATVASAVFSVDSGSPFSLAAGASASVAIRFAPLAAESYQADVILTSNGGGSTNPASGYGFIVAGSTNTSWSLVAGKPTLDFQLVSGALYRVQGSTNLLVESTWEDLTAPLTNRSGGGSITFVETNSPVPVQRAYRIRSP